MNNLIFTTRFLTIKNITLETFKEKTNGNYQTQTSYSNKSNTFHTTFDLNFSWGEIKTYSFERRINDENFEKTIMYVTPKLYSCPRKINALDSNGEILSKDDLIKYKSPTITILEKNNDLSLIIKGGDDEQSKIRHKLLGGTGASSDSKAKWKDIDIIGRDEKVNIYPSDFLLWLISKFNAKYKFKYRNHPNLNLPNNDLEFKITDIISLQDNGISKKIKRKGSGSNLLNDPIVKAIIAGIDNINGLGFSIVFNNDNIIEFILKTDGSIELIDTCRIGYPQTITSNHANYFEIMTHIIFEEILSLLFEEFNNDSNWTDTEKHKLKLEFCIQTTENLCQILNINFSNSVQYPNLIRELIIK